MRGTDCAEENSFKISQDAANERLFRFQSLTELTSDCAYAFQVSPAGELECYWIADSLLAMTGYSLADLQTLGGWEHLIHPDDAAIPQRQLEALLSRNDANVEYRIITKKAETRWVHDRARAIADEKSGKISNIYGALRDITEQKRAHEIQLALFQISEATGTSKDLKELLKTLHMILSTLIDTTNFYVALYNANTGLYTFPRSIDEFDGTDFGPEELKMSLTDYVRRTGKPLLADEQTHAGLKAAGEVDLIGEPSKIWLGVPLVTPSEIIGVVVVQSYTKPALYTKSDLELLTYVSGHIAMAIERKRTESELRLKDLCMESAINGIGITDLDGKLVYINEASTKMWGYDTRAEVIGRHLSEFWEGNNIYWTIDAMQSAGSRVGVDVGKRKDGSLFTVQFSTSLIKNEDGQPQYTYSSFIDITELEAAKKHEQELQDRLEQAKRMESLGVLAGGVAHDLNNMLGPLVGYPELLLRRLPEKSPLRKQIQRMGKAAQDAADVIQDLLTLARRGRYEMRPTDLNKIVGSYLDSHGFLDLTQRNPKVNVKLILDPNLGRLSGSDAHLTKVLMNLVVNAFDAMLDGGELTIETTQRNINKLISRKTEIKQGEYIVLQISDTGIGIAPEDLERIFEPYYSKKKMGSSGSGLGLAVVNGVVKDHNGYYDILSKLDEGTAIILYFPSTELRISHEQLGEMCLNGEETVLVVDDSEEQCVLASAVLTDLGYEVITMNSGRDAVGYLRDHCVDIVVLDMIMEHDFDGLDTYREIIKVWPKQKTVIVSGFSATERVQEMQRLGAGPYIKKPYTRNDIGRAVRTELGKRPVMTIDK